METFSKTRNKSPKTHTRDTHNFQSRPSNKSDLKFQVRKYELKSKVLPYIHPTRNGSPILKNLQSRE